MRFDQAQNLRALAAATSEDARSTDRRPLAVRTLAITGGKGGVGKSSLAVALAICGARSGLRVALLDADFGLAKLHIMLGLSPRGDLRDVVAGTSEMADILLDGPEGIRLLPGASGLTELANLDPLQRDRLLSGLEEIASRFDLILLDTGAGIGEATLAFVAAADAAVVVTTPEPAALSDAYALIKVAGQRRADLPFHLLINNATSAREADAAARGIAEVAGRFLQRHVGYAGQIPADPALALAARARKPFLMHAPHCPASEAVRRVAPTLLPAATLRADVPASPAPSFAQRFASLFLPKQRLS